MSKSDTTVIRDFGGGLNVVDDDLNLSSSFQPVLDNVHRGVDNTLSVRWGTELFADLRMGMVAPADSRAIVINWVLGSRKLTIDWLGAHGLQNGDHLTFTIFGTNSTGLKLEEILNIPLGVRITDANHLILTMRSPATATGVQSDGSTFIKDTHWLTGDIIDITYYNDHLVVFDTTGEIVKINAAMQVARIWDSAIAFAQSTTGMEDLPGWTSPIDYVSTTVFQGRLIACNGIDKPLEIEFGKPDSKPDCMYLVDKAAGQLHNAFVPVCKYVLAMDRWVVMAGDRATPYRIHISASDTSGTFTGAPPPNDACQLDLNNSNSSSLFIRGINKFRDLLAVAFDDTVAMVQLGIFTTVGTVSTHKPEVTDSVARHGSLAHKSMSFLGFDLIMADPIGVPTFAKSQFDNSIIPSRMSEFISPLIQRNVGRLAPSTLEKKVFSVFSTHDSRYILFMPDYDGIEVQLPNDPIYFLAEFIGTNRVLLRVPNHGMEEGDKFTLSGVDSSPITLPSVCYVDTVVTADIISFLLESPNIVTTAENVGGTGVKITRIKTETTAYALTYNKGLKIKAWSRYKGWNFNAGTTSLYGRVFLASNSRIWRMGNRFDPIYADYINNYDVRWVVSTAYTVGQKVYDATSRETYTCKIAHTSGTTTFLNDRDTFVDNWEQYKGEPIEFAVEFPWADFDKRDITKIMKTINVDAKGRERFTIQMFLDYYYRHKLTGVRTPLLSMDMMGGDEGAFGVAEQSYGAGRIATRQRPWPFQARGKLFKLRLQGFAREPLRFIAFIFSYKLVGRQR